MKMLYFLLFGIFGLIFTVSPTAYSQTQSPPSLETLISSLSPQDTHTLMSGYALTRTSTRKNHIRVIYTPDIPIFERTLSFIATQRPHILYENLFFFEEEDQKKQKDLVVTINNYLRDVEVLASIEYKNLKDGHIHPLFTRSFPIVSFSNPTDRSPLLPLTVQNSTLDATQVSLQSDTLYVSQDMPPFGQVFSRYQYTYHPSHSEFQGNNTSEISYKGIRAVKKDNMLTSCWIIQTDRGVLLYGIGAVRISGIASLFRSVIENSFNSRMAGLFLWLNTQIMSHTQ